MPLLAVLASGLAGFAFGALWYMALANVWQAAAGLSEETITRTLRGYRPYLLALLANLIVAGALRHLFAAAGISGAGAGLSTGLSVGAFVAAPWLVMAYAFAARGLKLTLIDAAHVVGACGAIGLVLGLFL